MLVQPDNHSFVELAEEIDLPFEDGRHRPPSGGMATRFRSPMFNEPLEAGQDFPDAACSSCPSSFWYLDDELRCVCTVLKIETWNKVRSPVRACVGRESALAALAKAQAALRAKADNVPLPPST